jgi:hypothetical protein
VGTPNPPAPLPDARSAEPANTPIASATLLIRSASPAQVRVDGELRGRTPLDLSLAPGAHRLLLLSDDGEEDAVRLELASGQVLEHNHHFAGFGKLAVVAEPWIEVSLDDGPFRETPVYFDRAQAGPHKIRGRRPGFAPVELEVSVEKGQTRSVRIDPRPLRGSE